jgi:BTB/POZ domain
MISYITGNCIFEAGEDLLNESKSQVLVFKGTTKTIELSSVRPLSSYCFEFCGMCGLSFQTLRFQNMGRDVKLETSISDSVHLTVSHKAEFSIEPPNNLKSSMKNMLMNSLYSDIKLKVREKSKLIPAHRCILYNRSKPLKDLIDMQEAGSDTVDVTALVKDDERSYLAFSSMINFLYSGEIVFPRCPFQVIEILKLAKIFAVEDLEEICEDDITKKMDLNNIVEILLILEKDVKVTEETYYRVRSFFLNSFEVISHNNPDIEDQLATCPGLVKKLFLHLTGKKKTFKRKVTFVDFDINADSHDL